MSYSPFKLSHLIPGILFFALIFGIASQSARAQLWGGNAKEKKSTIDSSAYSALQWRTIGPYRAGRSVAVGRFIPADFNQTATDGMFRNTCAATFTYLGETFEDGPVSLTVTEGGYNFHPVSGAFDLEAPDIRHDLSHPEAPRTTFGLIVEGLARRRERGIAPFTVMSCDNIQGNGDVARETFTAYARARDPELAAWIEAAVAFPNAMVDRITPVTSEADIAELSERFGVEDAWPVVCEPFTQWVLEDHFVAGRPPLERVGVQLVDDVVPYEMMKLRLLNASHQALAYLGYLAGYRYAHEVCQDPLFVDFLLGYMRHEASPTLSPVPGIDLEDYRRTLIERFANPEVRDTLSRLCAESSDRIPKWLVPVIRQQLESGGEMHRSAAVVASWARYAEGVDEQGEPIEVVDRLREELMALAKRNHERPTAFIENRELFGDLAEQARFRDAYVAALTSLHEKGARATLERLAATGGAS